jgi:multidrug resistance efflux pump
VAAAIALAAIFLVRVPYRAEADFVVRPERQMLFTAPFDGFVSGAPAQAGTFVAKGDALFALDDNVLRLEEAETLAEASRYERERERADAEGRLAEMRVAAAQGQQVAARLARLRREIAQATVRAPFAGYVLDDGNLSQRLGAPVRQGDTLLRFAKLDGLYFELAVPERDAPLIASGGTGEVAFSGQPRDTQPVTITRVEPEAVARETGAVFLARAAPAGAQAEWWRPGMTGIAKIKTEKRSLFDIFTRRLRDWLHLKLWW